MVTMNKHQNQLGHRISEKLAEIVENSEVKYGLEGKALLHAQVVSA